MVKNKFLKKLIWQKNVQENFRINVKKIVNKFEKLRMLKIFRKGEREKIRHTQIKIDKNPGYRKIPEKLRMPEICIKKLLKNDGKIPYKY